MRVVLFANSAPLLAPGLKYVVLTFAKPWNINWGTSIRQSYAVTGQEPRPNRLIIIVILACGSVCVGQALLESLARQNPGAGADDFSQCKGSHNTLKRADIGARHPRRAASPHNNNVQQQQ